MSYSNPYTANGDTASPPPNNHNVILFVVLTVCLSALIGVATEAICVIYKIPDMGGPIGGGFMHTVDTIFGALIGMLITTRSQQAQPPPQELLLPPTPPLPTPKTTDKVQPVVVTNDPQHAVPTTDTTKT